MKRSTFLKALEVIAILLFIIPKIFSQITTVDYQNWTPPSPIPCNLFATNTVVNNLTHLTAIGDPVYNSENAVELQSKVFNGTIVQGTEFRITYPFKKYYHYKITVTTKRVWVGTVLGPDISLRLDMNNGGTGNNTSCTGPQDIDGTTVGGYKRAQAVSSTADYTDYILEWNSLPDYQGYLMVAAFLPNTSAQPQNIYIRKIKIEESLDIDFNLSPQNLSIVCGSSTSQNFSITPNDVLGVTYEWSLGSSNNGWLYNGSSAPQIIPTTTSSTLSLTPVCGIVQQNVTATIKLNGSNYRSYTSSVTNSGPPTLTISGPDIVCNSETYSIPNLPCNSTVVWSTSNQPNLATLSCTNCTQTTVSIVPGSSGGNEFLTATVTSCGVTQTTPTKQLRIGGYTQTSPFNTSGPHMWCKNQTGTVYVDQAAYPGLTGFSWGSVPTGWIYITGGGTGNYIVLRSTNSTSPPTGSINVTGTDVCGNSVTVGHFMYKSNCTSFRISPNPAMDRITIEEFDDNTGQLVVESNIKAIEIISKMGILQFKQQYISKSISGGLSIPVSKLKDDLYAVRIFDGLEWKSYNVLVQH